MTTHAFERRYDSLRAMVNRRLALLAMTGNSRDLREACRYILGGGGKRLRAILVILGCESAGGSARGALNAAAAVEVLHNFTLVHDDVMDNAVERRGRPTVHIRWDLNTALLAGDVLVGIGYRTLLQGGNHGRAAVARAYTEGLIEICEGQALDLSFERRNDVTLPEYFRMIGKKTGALLAAALEIGGLLGNAKPGALAALKLFGRHLGIAFQLQDDLLDVVADRNDLGKPIGGDILERKKTYLLLRALQRTAGEDARFLRRLTGGRNDSPSLLPGKPPDSAAARRRLITTATAIYRRAGVLDDARSRIRRTTQLALRALAPLPPSRSKEMLAWLAEKLVSRSS